LASAPSRSRREVSYVERDNRGPAERVGDRVCGDRDNAKKKGLLGKAAEVFSFIQVAQLSWADLITGCVGKRLRGIGLLFPFRARIRSEISLAPNA